MSDQQNPLHEFAGLARLFPLPNLVFFPQVMQPLHIFEPRYRQMTADALGDDRLIALVLPKPGWEADYANKPAIHPVACLGRIVTDQRLPDGRYNLLLRGLSRVRILEEAPEPKLYRVARVELLDDVLGADADEQAAWRRRLVEQAPTWLQQSKGDLSEQFHKLLKSDLPLGTLTDILAFALPLDAEFKQTLLGELDVIARLDRLLRHMGGPQRRFPPEFSVN